MVYVLKGVSSQVNYMTVPLLPDALLPEPGNLKAVSIDLGVPPGQKAEPGKEYTATVVFENESDQPYPGTPVAVLHGEYQATLYDENGQPLPKKIVGGKEVQVADFGKKGEPNARRTFTCKWHPFAQAKDGLTGMVNRDEIGKAHLETTYEDNIVSAEVDVNAVNLVAVAIDPGVYGEAEPNGEYTAAVDFKNDSGQYLTQVPVGGFNRQYRAVLRDAAGNEVQYADFAPGEIKTFYFKWHAPDAGSTRISGVINTDPLECRYNESTYDDNKIFAEVPVRDIDNSNPGDRRLNLQAYSKAGEDVYGNWHESVAREPFTAKWTDDVRATLTIERPTPPKGTLDWWEISWAKITYPRMNPDFAFGNPLPPQGTVTKSMNVPGSGTESEKKATITFEEDWALDGINSDSEAPGIWNDMRGELMAAYPKKYPISVNFKITYQYSYIVCGKDDCWTVTKTKSYTDTATANLLVNGAGQALFAE